MFNGFIFVRWDFHGFLETICYSHFPMKALMKCVCFLVVSMLVFLVKYPRFNIHTALKTSYCNVEEVLQGVQYKLFSVGAFSLLALLISSEREQPMELGFFNLLLGLIIDSSMEIPGKDGPNLWFMFGVTVLCVLLIFSRKYVDNLQTSRRDIVVANVMSRRVQEKVVKVLELLLAASRMVFVFVCPFSKDQFEEDEVLIKCFCFHYHGSLAWLLYRQGAYL